MKAKIETLKIKLGSKKITLTYEEAQALHSELAQIFSPPTYIGPMIIESPVPNVPFKPWDTICRTRSEFIG